LVALEEEEPLVVPQRIEREILIDAPIEVVWRVVTEPEHISGWFSDSVELDLRPGGEMVLRWDEHGTVRGLVERVEPPHFFSYRWEIDRGMEFSDGNATLVEFSLSPDGPRSTLLRVVESGWQDLAVADDEKQGHFDGHARGWKLELGELEEYARHQNDLRGER
jgi:uncharacterized protein YndB with AHSA1/START domain